MQMISCDVVVVGAGIAGASVAAELSGAGLDVRLVEKEPQPGYHATGRSAAILAQTYGDATIQKLTLASQSFFETPPPGFCDHPLLSPRPIVRIARLDQVERLRQLYLSSNGHGFLEWLEKDELSQAAPHLRQEYAVCGFRNASAKDLDASALLSGFLRQFRNRRGHLHSSQEVSALSHGAGGWTVSCSDVEFRCRIVVNAAGAWAGDIGGIAGAAKLPIIPMRRSAISFDAPAGLVVSSLPMVVDGDEEFYLKPEAGQLLASPADETPSQACDAQPEEIDIAICADRIQTAFDLAVRRITGKWAGLRTFVTDRKPLCGFDTNAPDFFWLAAQGGYGIQTAPALAALATSIITEAPLPVSLETLGFKISEVSPERPDLG